MSVKDIKDCTGCGLCGVICPKKCIDIKLNDDGFFDSAVDVTSCNDCGLCESVCPMIKTELNAPKNYYAVWSKNDEVLQTTTSGGAAYELSKAALKKGYKVCGVRLSKDFSKAEHYICDNIDDLEASKGSKYIQSYTVDAFNGLFDGGKYLVIGTPCQISAVANAAKLKNKRDNLILIDFFCHGVPSYHIWHQTKKFLINKHKSINQIKFRDKKFGWGKYVLSLKNNDNTFYYNNADKKIYFYNFFLGNLCLNNVCYDCNYKYLNSCADIRLGDLWSDKYKEYKKGVSAVITFSDKGEELLNEIKENCDITKEDAAIVTEGQIKQKLNKPYVRDKVIRHLHRGRSLKHIYKIKLFNYRLKSKLKSILKR